MSEHGVTAQTGFENFEAGSPHRRRLLREEQLIVQVAEKLVEILERENVTRTELGRRLGKSKGFVSQILAGNKNLTLRTVADVCDALGFSARLESARDFVAHRQLVQRLWVSTPQPSRLKSVMRPLPPKAEAEEGVAA